MGGYIIHGFVLYRNIKAIIPGFVLYIIQKYNSYQADAKKYL